MRMKLLSSAVILAAAATSVSAQQAVGNGSINVVQPLTVTSVANMDFGTIIRPATGTGTATISNAGALTVADGAVALPSAAVPQAAQFRIDGEGGQAVSLVIPATFTLNSNANALTITTSNDLVGLPTAQALSGALGTAGQLLVNVGGTVAIPAATPTGLYTGTLTVSASYN